MERLLDRRTVLVLAGAGAAAMAAPRLAAQSAVRNEPLERLALAAVVMRYAWAIDTLDQREAVGTFARDAVVRDLDGKRWDRRNGGAAGFISKSLASATPGGQHHVQVNRIIPTGNRYTVESYWSRIEWQAGAPRPVLTVMGTWVDTLVHRGGDWQVAEKRIALWNSATVRVAPVPEQAA